MDAASIFHGRTRRGSRVTAHASVRTISMHGSKAKCTGVHRKPNQPRNMNDKTLSEYHQPITDEIDQLRAENAALKAEKASREGLLRSKRARNLEFCVCEFDEDEEIVMLCRAHKDYVDAALQWVSILNRLPEENVADVLAYPPYDVVSTEYLGKSSHTHWMILPPRGKKNEDV